MRFFIMGTAHHNILVLVVLLAMSMIATLTDVVVAYDRPSSLQKETNHNKKADDDLKKKFQEGTSSSSSTSSSSQTEWPEWVGKNGKEAKHALEVEYPNWKIQLVPEGSMVTMDYRIDRVRIFINQEDGTVVGVPRIG